jgi:NAD(P)H-hydrate epimerase
MLVVTAAQMREIDRLTIHKYGVPSLTLMERAGEAVTRTILTRFAPNAKKGVLVIAGKGNNGGDGLVVARLLQKKRLPCEVALLARKHELSNDAGHNLRAYLKAKGKLTEIAAADFALLQKRIAKSGLVVDAIFGTGLNNEVRGLYAEAITQLNGAGLPVLAVDIPSGLHGDKGIALGVAVKAAMTVALAFPKRGEVIYPGVGYCGELVVADIGIDARAVAEVAPAIELLDRATVGRLVPRRAPDTHKGTYGHVLAIAGSRGKTGAAILACRAAMRTGAGLTTLAAPRSLNNIFAAALIEVMTELLPGNDAEELEPLSDDDWHRLLQGKDSVLFGPGIGVNDATRRILRWLLRNLDRPWVIDADGLNNLALELDRLRHAKFPPVITPHPGEMGRLIGRKAAEVNANRVEIARAFAVEQRCYTVLKGARTVMATPEGNVFINPSGNPGMASGGMGDALAGMLAALLGQGLTPQDAMKLGVYTHGFVGDRVAEARGEIGLIASDVIDSLPEGLKLLAATAL